MFTGLIETQGIVTHVERAVGGARLQVYAPEFGRDMALGDSIAVDGACLTVSQFQRGAFVADVSEETLSKTTLSGLRQGAKVNLERALRLSDRIGGHLVTGHVEGLGKLLLRHPSGNSTIYQFQVPFALMEFIVPKGSIAIDGISLTVAQIRGESFAAAVVPHTEEVTTLREKPIGAAVNVEVDMMAKYVKRFVDLYAGGAESSFDPKRRGLGDMLRDFTDGEVTAVNAARAHPPFSAMEEGIAELAAGRMLIVVDDEDRENEGDLVMAAEKVTPEAVNFMARYGRGLICMPLTGERMDALGIPPMADENTSEQGTAFHCSIGAKGKITTGISAADRAVTIATAISDDTRPEDISMPGHVFPLRARPGGVLERAGHTEAAVDLARLAGLAPAGVICEIMNDDGTMARRPELEVFSAEHGLKMITVADLIRYRRRTERLVVQESKVKLPTRFGDFTGYGFRSLVDDRTHMALVVGEVAGREDVLVRVHSECLTGDVFHSLRCDCGAQLEEAMRRVQAEGCGVILYIVGHEGRGIGLANKLRAYELQEAGADTVEANEALGFSADLRDYGIGAQILCDLGLHSIRLMTNNPRKIVGLEGYGLNVTEQVPLEVESCEANIRYLQTKKDKLSHTLTLGGDAAEKKGVS